MEGQSSPVETANGEEDENGCDKSTTTERSTNSIHHQTLPLTQRLAFSVGHVQNDLCSAVWFTYLLVYMQQILQFSPKLAGATLLIGQIADGLATPFVGLESDREPFILICLRYGKRKAWHLLGTLAVAVTFPLIFTKCIGCEHSHESAQFIYYAALIVIFQFGWAAVQISHLSLIPVLTPCSKQRVELNAWRYAFTVAANITVYSVAWAFLGLETDGRSTNEVCPRDAGKFQYIVLVVVTIGVFFSFLFHSIVNENQSTSSFDPMRDSVDYSLRANHLRWHHWFALGKFYKVGLLYMATRLNVNLTQAYIPFYLQETLNLSRVCKSHIH